METIAALTSRNAQSGLVQWMGICPLRREPMKATGAINVLENGIEGDHYQSGGKRSITLIQYEHLFAIASYLRFRIY